MKSLLTFALTAALAVSSFSLTSCDTVGDRVLGGAAVGAIAGGLTGSGRNAAAGAAIGAAAGGLIGVIEAENEQAYYGRGYSEPYRSYPVARRTDRRNFVISPYSPYYEINVRGVPSGALVRDPSCNRLFIRP